jgi:hypothetical protein
VSRKGKAHGQEIAERDGYQLEEWEFPILARAGKAHRFEEVRHVPAIQVFHFQPLSRH